MLFPSIYEYTGANEALVTTIWQEAIKAALDEGRDVIVHDTNLDPRPISFLRTVSQLRNIPLECRDFLHVSVEDCISRDAQRVGRSHVGEEVINRMASKWAQTSGQRN